MDHWELFICDTPQYLPKEFKLDGFISKCVLHIKSIQIPYKFHIFVGIVFFLELMAKNIKLQLHWCLISYSFHFISDSTDSNVTEDNNNNNIIDYMNLSSLLRNNDMTRKKCEATKERKQQCCREAWS